MQFVPRLQFDPGQLTCRQESGRQAQAGGVRRVLADYVPAATGIGVEPGAHRAQLGSAGGARDQPGPAGADQLPAGGPGCLVQVPGPPARPEKASQI